MPGSDVLLVERKKLLGATPVHKNSVLHYFKTQVKGIISFNFPWQTSDFNKYF